jgi:AraC family transcriptional activator FtrA
MTIFVKIPPKQKRRPRTPANRLVAVLVYDGLCSFEYGCAAEVFGLARPEFNFDWYQFIACAVERGPLRATGGMSVTARGRLSDIAKAGTVIIPGWRGVDVAPAAPLLLALRTAHARGARLLSICSGAFVLAATGLLDGMRATTHWRYAQALRERYPRVEVDANVLYVDNGQILTSAGSAAGLDLCLHLVRRDYGAEIANQVARRLVIAPHRSGGQAQFIQRPMPRRDADDRLSRLLDGIGANPADPATIGDLARRATMSERTLLRRFRDATGTTPADWIAQARLDRARELLEGTALSIEDVARECGFGSAMTLRHHFRHKLALSPSEYKGRFGKKSS